MNSAMMEIYAFIHSPLRKHAHVVRLLGLAWRGGNPFDITYCLPVLVVEYAERRDLASLHEKELLSSELKQSLCLDISLGLDILHRCGIMHGDVKTENILVFPDSQKTYIAKVADFGFSVVEILEICLSKEPELRVLSNVINILREEADRDANPAFVEVLQRSFNHHILSWQKMREFPPAVQTFVFEAMRQRQKLDFCEKHD
jgi:serine/threonine protein kinase